MQTVPLVGLLPFLFLVSVAPSQGGAIRRKRSDDVTSDTLLTAATHQSHLQAELTSLQNQFSRLETSLQNKVSRLENNLGSSQNQTSRAVAFTARISSDRDRNLRGLSLGFQQTIVFNDVLTNVGNAYNNHTGIFLSMMGVTKWHDRNSRDIYLVIVKNGAILDTVMAHGGFNLFDQGSTLVTTQLRQGDHVWVRQNSGNAVRGYHWTVFTGYLLHAQ